MKRLFDLKHYWLFSILCVCLSPLMALAQSGSTSGTIVGIVKDPSAAIIAGATVSARQLDTNFTRTIQSDDQGNFRLTQLPPGKYELKATAENFLPAIENITLTLGTTVLADLVLRIDGQQSVIEVKANSELEPRTESSTNNERTSIESLPSNRRNFLDLALTSPRVTMDRLPERGIVITSGISINSQSARFNNITIDGLDNNDYVTGSVRSTFNQDGVQEFQIVSDSYAAEFGRVLGGVINIVTRGGGNQVNGELFLLNRLDELSARDVFAQDEPDLRRYQFGATLSGPIKKDRAFFFTSFERLSSKQSNIVTINDQVVKSARLLNFPLRNGPVPFALGTTTLLARLDAQLNANDRLWLRYNGGFTYNGAYEPFRGNAGESSGGIEQLTDNTIAANNTYISTSLNLINETRLLYGQRDLDILPLGEGPFVQIDTRMGQVSFGRNPFLPQLRSERIYQFVDNVTLPRGKHQFKFGVDLSYTSLESLFSPILNSGAAIFTSFDIGTFGPRGPMPGSFFSPLQAFDPGLRTPQQRVFLTRLATMLNRFDPNLFPANLPLADLALPLGYTQSFGNPQGSSNYQFLSLFFQDDYRVKPNLIIKAGLRYDQNRVRFAPDTDRSLSPRFAISYRPAKLEQLNLRASYGIFVGAPLAGVILNAQISSANLLSIALPFPFSILPFALPGHRVPEANQPPRVNSFDVPQNAQTFSISQDLNHSYTQQASIGVDYAFNQRAQLSINYDYVRGNRLFGSRNINPIISNFSIDRVNDQLPLRNDQTRGDVFELESGFDSYYHAFTALFNYRATGRFGLLAHYTFSKAIDNIVDFFPLFQEIQDPLNPGQERSLSIQDARHRFVLSGNWSLDYSKNALLRDYQLATIISLNSGRPYNLLAGVDIDGNGDRPPADRPMRIGRNAGITPGFANVDLRFSRTINVNEQFRVQAYIEALNLFNRVNINPNDIDRVFPPDKRNGFKLPPQENGRFIANPQQFRGAFPARLIQFGFRLSF